MMEADAETHQDAVADAIAAELGGLRASVETAIAASDAGAVAEARAELLVALVCFGRLEFDLEARFHLARVDPGPNHGAPVTVAAALLEGDVDAAIDRLAAVVEHSSAYDARLLKLTFSAVVRAGASCPELPWLATLLGRIAVLAERGSTAASLIPFLPQGGQTRADVAATATDCVGSLWRDSPGHAAGLSDMLLQTLIDVDDQALLAVAVATLLESLPLGHTERRNTLGYLRMTALHNAGDLEGSVRCMDELLDGLVAEDWDQANVNLLFQLAAISGEVAQDALAGKRLDLAGEAVALADRVFGVIAQLDASRIAHTDDERRELEHRLSLAFSRAADVAADLSQEFALPIVAPDPAPLFRFRPGETPTTPVPESPGQSARISEARFLEECARVHWKAIPTPLEVDFGLDYRIEIPEEPGRTSADVEFLVQLKSTSAAPNASGFLTVSIDTQTLQYWKSKVLPTLVVLFHHPSDRFFTAWYFPALDDAKSRTFRFALEDEWDPITLHTDVQRYYQQVRSALASGGDWSVLAVMQSHCVLLIRTILLDPDLRQAALDPSSDLSAAKTEHLVLTLLSMHHRALCTPIPLLAGQPDTEEIVGLLRTLDAIVRSWTISGPQRSGEIRIQIMATHLVLRSARDLLHVAVELGCKLGAAIVDAQEARSAALAGVTTGGE